MLHCLDTESLRRSGGVPKTVPKGILAATIQFVLYYHQERNHQELENKIIRPEFSPLSAEGIIKCRNRSGGMLSYYYREAA
jgi:hypothetical protein